MGRACSGSWSATRGVRSACLSLGRGTQPIEAWATTCCVPREVITPNVDIVKQIDKIARPGMARRTLRS